MRLLYSERHGKGARRGSAVATIVIKLTHDQNLFIYGCITVWRNDFRARDRTRRLIIAADNEVEQSFVLI
jgi:hypothetical protein